MFGFVPKNICYLTILFLRFDDDDDNFFSSQVKTIVVDFILQRTTFCERSVNCTHSKGTTNFGIEKLVADGVYKAAYPLHDVSIQVKMNIRVCFVGIIPRNVSF